MTQPSRYFALPSALPMPSAVKQINGLQILRAAAVVIVAWGHAGLAYMSPDGTHLPDLGVFGIDIFFVLSGFILSAVVLRSTGTAGVDTGWQFFKRRLVRIFPIYWFFAAINLVLLLHRHSFTSGYLYSALLLPFPHYPPMYLLVGFTWTLIYEMFFYLLLAVIQLFTVERAVEILICVLVALTSLRLVLSIQRPVLIVACNPMLLEFAYGSVIALAYRALGRRRKTGLLLVVTGSAAAFAFVACNVSSPTQQLILVDDHVLFRVATWGIAAAAIVAGTVFFEGDPRGEAGQFLVKLGNSSYSAYLASALTIYLCSRLLQPLILGHSHAPLALRALCQILSVAAVLVAGLATYRWVEWPMLSYLQKKLR